MKRKIFLVCLFTVFLRLQIYEAIVITFWQSASYVFFLFSLFMTKQCNGFKRDTFCSSIKFDAKLITKLIRINRPALEILLKKKKLLVDVNFPVSSNLLVLNENYMAHKICNFE